jgi:hypothetical protein
MEEIDSRIAYFMDIDFVKNRKENGNPIKKFSVYTEIMSTK